VSELIDRLKVSTTTLFGLPPSFSDLDGEEQRILRAAGLFAVAVFWFAVALVQPWLLLLLPLAVGSGIWFIRRRMLNRAESGEDLEDWSY
jgi:hypothetical protein